MMASCLSLIAATACGVFCVFQPGGNWIWNLSSGCRKSGPLKNPCRGSSPYTIPSTIWRYSSRPTFAPVKSCFSSFSRSCVAVSRFPGSGCVSSHSGQFPAPRRLRDAIERLEDVQHLARVVAVVRHVGKAELVGLGLVVSAELEEQHLQPRA